MATTDFSDMFVITLRHDQTAGFSVSSCEIITRTFRNRISFPKVMAIADVFSTALARELRETLASLGNRPQIHAIPDFKVHLPGLILGGLRVMISEARAGAEHIILRFKYMIGGVQSAFRLDVGLHEPVLSHRERIAVEALVDIAGPLMSLAHLDDETKQSLAEKEGVARKLRALSENSHELRFYSELLIRYVRECNETERRRRLEDRGGDNVHYLSGPEAGAQI